MRWSRSMSYATLYVIVVTYVSMRLYYIPGNDRKHPQTYIEDVVLDCGSVLNGTGSMKKAKAWNYHFNHIESEIFAAHAICVAIKKYFNFESKPLSQEEADFPLAYGLVMYKNLVQILLELSIFYHSQNHYCITIDEAASPEFSKALRLIPRCFPNVAAFVGTKSSWASFGILENVYNCFQYLTTKDKKWEYYQYLSGSDLPLRTNLEMVRVMKALNGSINTETDPFESYRYMLAENKTSPFPLYKSSMSVAVPRAGADFIVRSARTMDLLKYLSKTFVADESFWTSLFGNMHKFNPPGAFQAAKIIWLRRHFATRTTDEGNVTSIGTSYIGRYQVWDGRKPCLGKMVKISSVFGVGDMPEVVKRPELVAHKLYLDFEPAAFMCLLKELRRRSYNPVNFNTSSYEEMPTVEIHNGKSIMELTHPEWLLRSSFWRGTFIQY